MEETKQGVAQKFIDQRKRVHEYLSSHGDYAAVNTGHALEECQDLVRMLSVETRKQFEELRLGSLSDDPDLTHDEQVHAAGFIEGFRYLSDCLGLTLEGEDE